MIHGRGALLLWAASCCLPSVFAQAPSPPEQFIQEGLRRQDERARELGRQLVREANELAPGTQRQARQLPRAESPCIVLRDVELTGDHAVRFRWLADHARPFFGHCVGAEGLSIVASTLDAVLLDLGYVTSRVSLPPQNLEAGRLLVHLHAGTVHDIRLSDDAWGTWWNAFPTGPGALLNARDIEQGVENVKRLPSQQVTTRLEPGPTPDSSIVVIERRAATWRDRTRGGITLDNSGGAFLGRAQMSGSVALDNPTGLNDVLSAWGSSNVADVRSTHRSQSLTVNYAIPWGHSLLTITSSRSRFAQAVQGTTVRFLSSGHSETHEVRAAHVLRRTSSSKLSAHAALSARRARSFLDDTELIVQRRRTRNIDIGGSWRQVLEQSTLDVDVNWRRGVPWLGAQEDFTAAEGAGLTLRPRILSLQVGYAGRTSAGGRPLQFTSQLRAQRTPDTTLSIDQIAIGGRGSVRGFDGDAVANAVEALPAGAKIHVDHILPQAEFYKMDGFEKLPAEVQHKLMNDPANLQPMICSANCSKGTKVEYSGGWPTWNGQAVHPDYSRHLELTQSRIAQAVDAELRLRGIR